LELKKILIIIFFFFLVFTQISEGLFIGAKDVSRDKGINFIELVFESIQPIHQDSQFVKYGPSENNSNMRGILTTPGGIPIKFRGQNEAVNFFRENGWKVISSFSKCKEGSTSEHFLFKKI